MPSKMMSRNWARDSPASVPSTVQCSLLRVANADLVKDRMPTDGQGERATVSLSDQRQKEWNNWLLGEAGSFHGRASGSC